MNSGLYECRVMHARLAPKRHRFAYRMFLFALDLDELPTLSRRLALFAVDRPQVYTFRDRDYLPFHAAGADAPTPPSGPGLKARVAAYLATQGIDLAGGRVCLLTLPRLFGYGFNPVSFYFCFTPNGAPLAAIAEVTNTFREVKPYLLGPATRQTAPLGGQPQTLFRLRVPKQFYVSPFSDVDVEFDFQLRPPHERLALQIDDYTGGRRTLVSTLEGRWRPLTDARLAWWLVKYPLLTLRVMGLIHWHALRLWLKRIPWFAKAARAAEQRGLYRPHRSLAPAAPPP